MAAVAIMTAMNVSAQRIQVTDNDGNAIPMVSVLAEDGTFVGTTDIDGVLSDVRGHAKVTLSHVAYKPQLVSVASLSGGRVTMEDLDYGLQEIVVKPKPYIYVENYYRAYVFRGDSLVFFKCGIMPNVYDVQKKKAEHGSGNQAYAEYAPTLGHAVNWEVRVEEWGAGTVNDNKGLLTDEFLKDKYMVTTTDRGAAGKTYSNPEGKVGQLIFRGNQAVQTFDGGKMQMYADKVKGRTKLLQKRQKKGYAYRATLVHNHVEGEPYDLTNFVMKTNHWEYTDKKSRVTIVIEGYATDHGYMDKGEWKAKKKELKEDYKTDRMQKLNAHAAHHGIPALSPSVQRALQNLKFKIE